jgi:MFS family permease
VGDRWGLWGDADFRWLWAGNTVSRIGSQVSFLALPLVAALTLGATPFQMGLLGAASGVPPLLLGLFVGAWVDRRPRRWLMIGTDLARGVLLLAIPLAAALDRLSMALLCAVIFATGCLTLVFDVAAQSFLPTLVRREALVEANGKLETARSAAELVGPGLAGVLVQLAGAPLAVVADACSYLASGALIGRIRAPERVATGEGAALPLGRAIGEGLRWVVGHRLLGPLVGVIALVTFFNSVLEAVALLYLSRSLALAPATIGVVFALGSAGFLLGALGAARLTARLGLGPTLIAALALLGLADLIVPLAGGSPLLVGGLLVVAQFGFGCGLVVFNINSVSLRQGLTPDRLQGRVSASVRLLAQGLTPLGALGGGLLGEWLGLRATLFVAVAGELAGAVWLLLSPLRGERQLSVCDDEAAEAVA